MTWPVNLADVLGDLAYIFHFSPGDLYAFDHAELMYWHGQARRIDQQFKRSA